MSWPKGRKRPGQVVPVRGPGRAKGQQNKITHDIKAMMMQSLSNQGGVAYFDRQAKENPGSYMALLGRLVPYQMKIETKLPSEDELAAMTPLDMLKWTMRACMQAATLDPTKLTLMVDAANKAAQYEHPKLASIEHRGSLSLDDLSIEQLRHMAAVLGDPQPAPIVIEHEANGAVADTPSSTEGDESGGNA